MTHERAPQPSTSVMYRKWVLTRFAIKLWRDWPCLPPSLAASSCPPYLCLSDCTAERTIDVADSRWRTWGSHSRVWDPGNLTSHVSAVNSEGVDTAEDVLSL